MAFLEKLTSTHTSPEIQNGILMLMSHMALRDIATRIHQAKYFTIMAVKCVDLSNYMQLVICFWYTNGSLAVYEDLMGLYKCDNTTEIRLNCQILRRYDDRLYLKLANRSQCYDGGSKIAGSIYKLRHSYWQRSHMRYTYGM